MEALVKPIDLDLYVKVVRSNVLSWNSFHITWTLGKHCNIEVVQIYFCARYELIHLDSETLENSEKFFLKEPKSSSQNNL